MPRDKFDFKSLSVGDRFLYRKNYMSSIMEDAVLEMSPSGKYVKLRGGWTPMDDLLTHHVFIEVLGKADDADDADMDACPNCVTPWKCNGPHIQRPCVGAPGGSPDLEAYMRSLGLL